MTARRLLWFRRICQAAFLIFFLWLCVQTRIPPETAVDYSLAFDGTADVRIRQPVDFFFQLDPLLRAAAALSGQGWLAGIGWVLLVLGITGVLGRVFCGFVCPFGTIHQIAGAVSPSGKAKEAAERNNPSSFRRIKYILLAAVLAAAAFGLNVSGLLDPIALLFRSLALAVLPGIGIFLKEIFDVMAASDIKILNLLSYGAEILVSPVFGYGYPAFQTGWVIGAVFLFLVAVNRFRPRFWCRTLCPLGALLGVAARFGRWKVVQDPDKCTGCNRCLTACQGAASPRPGTAWNQIECMFCLNCVNHCPEGALDIRLSWFAVSPLGPDVTRRAVLAGLSAGLALPMLGRLDGRVHVSADYRLIRPPGAMEEIDFLQSCLRCGLCMKACPTHVIHPTLSEAGMAGIWTPVLLMTRGYCEFTCTLCSTVCPSGAIAPITAAEKRDKPIRIGSASVDRGRCLPWSGNGPCIVCQELCPTSPKAIYLIDADSPGRDGKTIRVQLPHVDLKHCVGCGICENKCPVRGQAAIRVIAAGETRSPKNWILLDG